MQDLLATLRPALERLTSFEEAVRVVAAIEASEARSAAAGPAGLSIIEEEDSASDDSGVGSGSDSDAGGMQKLLCSICLSLCGSLYWCISCQSLVLIQLRYISHEHVPVMEHVNIVMCTLITSGRRVMVCI